MKTRNDLYSPEFVEFWKTYPRRVGKRHAFQAFVKSLERGATVSDLLRGAFVIQEAVRCGDLSLRFCPYPATWLNRDQQEDEHIGSPSPAEEGMQLAKEILDAANIRKRAVTGEQTPHLLPGPTVELGCEADG
ncbi:MAG: hypothetical protein GY800_05065, partial [Planctomycetes bacterium]|nr:hypothetical protein [Planctomycetota bacterium]